MTRRVGSIGAVLQNRRMPRVVQPAGSDDTAVSLLGNPVSAGILRYLRAHPHVTLGPISDALELGATTIRQRLFELVAAGLVLADPPATDTQSRRGVWVRYSVDEEAVTDLYLRLGLAIGEF